MFGDIKKLQGMMSKMGIKQKEISSKRVVIESENKNIIIEDPSVVKIEMQGQISWQITGREKEMEKISEADLATVMEKTSCSKEQAIKALDDSGGDLAEAILKLSGS